MIRTSVVHAALALALPLASLARTDAGSLGHARPAWRQAAKPDARTASTDGDRMLRMRAGLLRAEDERNASDPAIMQALAHPVAAVRARAVRALGRIGDPATVDLVSKSMVDRDPGVRREAAFALGEIGSPAALTSLSRGLSSDDAELRAISAEALSKIAWSPAEKTQAGALVIVRVLRTGAERDPSVVARAVQSSWRFGAQAPGLVQAVANAYLRPEHEISEAAAYAAARLADPRLGGTLELAARDERASVRASAVRGLGRLAHAKDAKDAKQLGDERRALLVRRALDVDPNVRLAALAALDAFEPADPLVTQDVMDVTLRSQDWGLQRQALLLAGAWGLDTELPTVMRFVQQGPRDVFPEAAASIVKMRGDFGVALLDDAARSPDWTRRAAVADALNAEGLGASKAVVAMQDALLKDPDPRVVASALDAATASGRSDAAVIALAHLGAADPVVRAVAAQAIPKLVGHGLTRDEAAAALRRAWRESAADATTDARITELEALHDTLGAESRADLVAGASDHDWTVRMKAQALGAGMDLPPLGTASLGRPFAFYVERARDEMAARPAFLRFDTERGPVDVELATKDAPLTVFQLTQLAGSGFYDGLTFHRVVADFVAQGGCPRGDGWGGPGMALRCEINRLPYDRGAAGMALSGKDTGGSQFFFTLSPQPHLDGGYTVFGHVTPQGMEVVDRIRRFDVIRSARVIEGSPALAVAVTD